MNQSKNTKTYDSETMQGLYDSLLFRHRIKVGFIIACFVLFGVAAISFLFVISPVLTVICIVFGLLCVLVAIILGGSCQRVADEIYQYSPEYQSERKHAQERKVEIAQAQHPICPACHGNNTRRISTTKRVVSTSLVGLASSTIGKQYECLDCQHKW